MPRLGLLRPSRVGSGAVSILLLAVSSACERTEPAPGRKDTAVAVTPPPESATVQPPPSSAWDSSAGPALFLAGQAPTEATVILGAHANSAALDTTRFDIGNLRAIVVDLFAAGKRMGTARVNTVRRPSHADSCAIWPVATLNPTTLDSTAPALWTVGFQTGHAAEVALDSIEGLPRADSSRLAAEVARIASALPDDTAASFRGLPFVVTKAWRARALDRRVLVAIVVRNVNQEANPRQERLLLVAERDTAASPSTRFTPVYHERVSGLEETIETTDLIAIVLLGAERRPTIVVTRDGASGSAYTLLERLDGHWQRRWTSAYSGC